VPAVTPWFVGAQVPVPAFFLTDTSGNPQNAAGGLSKITCTIYLPDGSTATPAIANPGTGQYQAVYTTTQAGHHVVAWASTDTTYPGAFSDSFEVQAAQDTTIVSLAEAKEILHLSSTTEFDAIIQGYNAAATNWIEYVCGPVVVQTVVERLPSRGVMQALSKPPLVSLLPWTTFPPGMATLGIPLPSPPSPMFPCMVFGIPYPLSQLYADPATGIVTHTSGLPFVYGSYMWQYQAGRPVIPAGIYEAAKIVLEHLFMVERGGAAAAMTAGEADTVMTGSGFAVPNRAATLLRPYSAASRMVVA
jgi:hypothetical protein